MRFCRGGVVAEKNFASSPPNCLDLAFNAPPQTARIDGMRRHNERLTAITHHEPAIEALLSRPEADSIVDLLLSLPAKAAEGPDTFHRIVSGRLEAKLAERMRSVIGDDRQQNAA